MYERAVRSDLLYWLALRLAPGVVIKTVLATPPEIVRQASAEEKQRVARLMEEILPLRERHAGLLNDAEVAQSLKPYALDQISAPTLAISLEDDLYGTYKSARYTATQIPRARFIGYKRGGHVWVEHHQQILAEVHGFLASHDPWLARR
jgi:pimeloyl-ACP methyl ester carboxylesterase